MCCCTSAWCQEVFDKTSFNVGEIVSPGYLDLTVCIFNHTEDDMYFMRIISDEGLASDINQSIKSGEHGLLNVRIQPEKRGKFKKEIALITQNTSPLFLTIAGKCQFVSTSELKCPDFNAKDYSRPRNTKFGHRNAKRLMDTIQYAHVEYHLNRSYPNNRIKRKHYYLLYDASLSMNESSKKEISHSLFSNVLNQFSSNDSISLFIYSQEMNALLHGTAMQAEQFEDLFENIQNEGYTDGYHAISKTMSAAQLSDFNGDKNLIIITDGAFNLNSGQITSLLAKDMTKDLVIRIFGIEASRWANQDLRLLARDLHGTYTPIESEKEATTFSLQSR